MASGMTLDPTTGNMIHMKEHRAFVTLVDDAAYFTLMVIAYDYTGVNRFFLQLPRYMSENPYVVQALRYGLMFGTMTELRRWLEMYGLSTDMSHYLDSILGMFR